MLILLNNYYLFTIKDLLPLLATYWSLLNYPSSSPDCPSQCRVIRPSDELQRSHQPLLFEGPKHPNTVN